MIDMACRERAKKRIYAEGLTMRQWAERHGFKPLHVYRFLDGTLKGRNGVSHHIAMALGVKQVENTEAA